MREAPPVTPPRTTAGCGTTDAEGRTPLRGPEQTRRRTRRSTALAALVLVAATILGGVGGARAAGLLIGEDIRNDSVRSIDFRDGSITVSRFRDRALTQADVTFDLIGPRGPTGLDGPRGFPGIRSITVRTGAPVSLSSAGTIFPEESCNVGEFALSGGATLDAVDSGVFPTITYSGRSSGTDSARDWVTRIDTPGGSIQYTPWVICAGIS